MPSVVDDDNIELNRESLWILKTEKNDFSFFFFKYKDM